MYEEYPQNKFRLQTLPLQRCGHYGAHACRVCWSFWKARAQFADNRNSLRIVLCVLNVQENQDARRM
jgi:hypothetical protein